MPGSMPVSRSKQCGACGTCALSSPSCICDLGDGLPPIRPDPCGRRRDRSRSLHPARLRADFGQLTFAVGQLRVSTMPQLQPVEERLL